MSLDLAIVRFGLGTHPMTEAPTGNRDLCIMEAVAFVAGEPWGTRPVCASPVLAGFLRPWHDALPDEARDRLLPASVWVPRLLGSRGTPEVEERRSWLSADWLVRVQNAAWMELTPALRPHAEALRGLPEITAKTLPLARATIVAANIAAREAAGDPWPRPKDTKEDSARVAAWYAARYAARDAALLATRVSATLAVGVTMRDAARDAATHAAMIYTGEVLRPTVEVLQQSALDLLDRMLKCGDELAPLLPFPATRGES